MLPPELGPLGLSLLFAYRFHLADVKASIIAHYSLTYPMFAVTPLVLRNNSNRCRI